MSDDDRASPPLSRRIADFPLVALMLALLLYTVATRLGHSAGELVPPLAEPAGAVVHMIIMLAFVLAMYKLVIARLGERPHDDLPVATAVPELSKGIAAGASLFCAVAAIAAVAGAYRIIGRAEAPDLLVPLISTAIMPAFTEELLFRGILFRWIEEFGGSWAALLITAMLFGLAHWANPNATWFSSFAIAVEAGLMFGGAYMLTRSLWMPIGLHAAWNFTQGPILGVPVSGLPEHGLLTARLSGPALLSGGAFGLEASVIALVVAGGAGGWFVWLAVKRGEGVRPSWTRHEPRPMSPAETSIPPASSRP
jgi:membrane protease YdiL (CAAX protease family)